MLAILLLGAAVSLAGDACHVASHTTRYRWDGFPTIWRSAIWFPVLVAGGVLSLADMGRRLGARFPPVRSRSRGDVLPAAAAVLGLYALTAALHGHPYTVSVVTTSAVAIVIWGVWDPSPGAALGGLIAAVVGPLVEIGIVGLGAAEYMPGSDGLAGVAPWLPALYFAAGAVAFRLWDALASPAPASPSPGSASTS